MKSPSPLTLISSGEPGGAEAGCFSSEESLVPQRLWVSTAASAVPAEVPCPAMASGCGPGQVAPRSPAFPESAGCQTASPNTLSEWGPGSSDALLSPLWPRITELEPGPSVRASPSATVALMLLCRGAHGISTGGSQPPQGSSWEESPILLRPECPYPHVHLRHPFYTPNPQHSGGAESRRFNPAPMLSYCFGTACKVRTAHTFLNG